MTTTNHGQAAPRGEYLEAIELAYRIVVRGPDDDVDLNDDHALMQHLDLLSRQVTLMSRQLLRQSEEMELLRRELNALKAS